MSTKGYMEEMTFKKRQDANEVAEQVAVLEKIIQGRGNSMCKMPKFETVYTCCRIMENQSEKGRRRIAGEVKEVKL